MRLRTSEVADATGGHLAGPDVEVDGATIDSRRLRGGELFVPIVAQRDGHDFVADALAAGAGAYLTSRAPQGGTAVVVPETLAALAALGSHARGLLPDRVVGITGSVGKTSVKDLLAATLSTTWTTAASAGSHNNELGVPLTLLGADESTEAVVVEMGARFVGDVRHLCAVARPTIGVVTAVELVHTETFGTLHDVARAKAELVEALPPHGTAVLNADEPLVAAMADRTAAAALRYGLHHGDVRAEGVTVDAELRPSFTLRSPWGDATVELAVRGRHHVGNALAAAAAALTCGVELEAVAAGLGRARLSAWRMALSRAPSGALVLNDAYNANPTSMAAALRALVELDASRHIAVLGTMAELGAASERQHADIAALAGRLGVTVVAVGEPAYGVEVVDGIERALDAVGEVGEGDAVLVKGSRVAGLERLAAHLLQR